MFSPDAQHRVFSLQCALTVAKSPLHSLSRKPPGDGPIHRVPQTFDHAARSDRLLRFLELDFNCSRLRQPWYPPLQRAQGWAPSVVVILANGRVGHPPNLREGPGTHSSCRFGNSQAGPSTIPIVPRFPTVTNGSNWKPGFAVPIGN
jgi:hypothetical protein